MTLGDVLYYGLCIAAFMAGAIFGCFLGLAVRR